MLGQAIRPYLRADDRQPEPRRRSARESDALVMTQIQQANRPLGAYDIAARMSRAGAFMVPNQVYRALARLMAQGRVVRIESLSAYFPAQAERDICLICTRCHAVSFRSAPDMMAALHEIAEAGGWSVSGVVIEAHGQCAACTRNI